MTSQEADPWEGDGPPAGSGIIRWGSDTPSTRDAYEDDKGGFGAPGRKDVAASPRVPPIANARGRSESLLASFVRPDRGPAAQGFFALTRKMVSLPFTLCPRASPVLYALFIPSR